MSSADKHPTWTQSYGERASLPNTSPLASYLLRLIDIKKTNLCLSADVSTTNELLEIAEEVGDSICLLKTHADIIDDWSDRTIKGLTEIARRKHFLIFEDRKFADIGGTVQKQYTNGPLKIARWAEITNAHIISGPAIVRALAEAASHTIAAYNRTVHTEISATPPPDALSSADISPAPSPPADATDEERLQAEQDRKFSVVSISTTISTRTEETVRVGERAADPGSSSSGGGGVEAALDHLGPAPYLRGLLLLAEMSSEGHLLTPAYRQAAVDIARRHPDFVLGFIAQRALNALPADNFLTMTPGCQLPPAGAGGDDQAAAAGDGLGQQYNTPTAIVRDAGCDVVIVGRGIVRAADRAAEAERYRTEAWRAYEERIGRK